MDNVVKTTQEIMDLFNDHAEIAGELSNDFNVILVYGVPVDKLIDYLEKEKFNRIDVNQELEYAIIDVNEYLAYYIVNEKWANGDTIVHFGYIINVENDRIETKLKIISVYRA